MIRYIDEALQLWAAELHPPDDATPMICGGGGSVLAALIDSRGELIRGTRGSKVLLEQSAEIELLVNKYLPDKERQVVIEHYTNHDSLDSQKWAACGCSRPQYYRRLHQAHESLERGLINRKRAA
ncbi:hypothetical protein VUJ49_09010 [Pseudomonas berkeleyensis]|uniref:DUF1492 domain-containing protein n=1 Tax=Pseudomonas berkeleyensis TaxID=2726956 RepID=A0A7G5DTV0_9PSED|nr:hypothetical protein [Pseudomonas berkeleyensis]QMV65175.1 hypothetical protein HS968_08975 [Pseudomonas berkeleyensis]WSO40648.1 hypothetical protein VUJ49_09010 [Pseudomonas berkeleyensis]